MLWIFLVTELPSEHSLYMEHALETLLEPVIEGVSKLKQTAQLSAVSMAATSLFEAWKIFILKEKIKFRYITKDLYIFNLK